MHERLGSWARLGVSVATMSTSWKKGGHIWSQADTAKPYAGWDCARHDFVLSTGRYIGRSW